MAEPTPPTTSATSGLTAVVGQAGAIWNKIPRGRRIAIALAAVAVLGGVAFLNLRTRTADWTALMERVSPEDGVDLTAALDGRGIPHRFGEDGTTVEVPPDRLAEARVVATAAGLPHGGAGFELFDHAQLGQSSFAEQVNYRRALQGEVQRSITTLAQVEGARVHVALGRRSVIKDADEKPSASVALRLHPGQRLTADQVHGVKQLVAASIEGLDATSVVVIDDHGNVLGGDEQQSLGDRDALEQATASRVRAILERMVGVGHVAVVATADIDQSRVNQTEDIYDKDRTALRSESQTIEGRPPAGSIGGVAGVQGNLPGAPSASATAAAGGGAADGRIQDTRNYEVTHTVRQTIGPAASVKKMHLAVLIDEPIGAGGKVVPRTADELAQLGALAHEAAGLDDARGDKLELRAVRFAPDEESAADPATAASSAAPALPWMYIAIGGGALALLLMVGGLALAVRRRNRRVDAAPQLSLPAPISEIERRLDSPNETPASRLPPPRPVHDRVLDSIRADVPRAARVLSAWLGEADGAPVKGATK